MAVSSMTRRAVNTIRGCAALRIAGILRRIGWGIGATQPIGFRPTISNSAHDDVDLLVSQHSAGMVRKRRHRGSLDSGGRDSTNRGIVSDGAVNRVAKCDRRPTLPF